MTRDTLPPISPEFKQALEEFDLAVDEVRRVTSPRLSIGKTLEDFFAERRSRGGDDVFTSENPGP